jgi:hypothetical protein
MRKIGNVIILYRKNYTMNVGIKLIIKIFELLEIKQ